MSAITVFICIQLVSFNTEEKSIKLSAFYESFFQAIFGSIQPTGFREPAAHKENCLLHSDHTYLQKCN